jgi:aqualysin 1
MHCCYQCWFRGGGGNTNLLLVGTTLLLFLVVGIHARLGGDSGGIITHRKLLQDVYTNDTLIVPHRYLIRFADSLDDHVNLTAKAEHWQSIWPEIEILHVYRNIQAIAVGSVVSSIRLYSMLDDPDVLFAEPDQLIYATAMMNGVQTNLDVKTWGIDRVDGEHLDAVYHYDYTGAGVQVYVVDSGIQASHHEFRYDTNSSSSSNSSESRARCGRNFRTDLGEDCHDGWGHGTHVAAIIGTSTTSYHTHTARILVVN